MENTIQELSDFLGVWYEFTKDEDRSTISSWKQYSLPSEDQKAVVEGVTWVPKQCGDKDALVNDLWMPLLRFKKLIVNDLAVPGVCPFLISESLSDALVDSTTLPEEMELSLTVNPLLVCHSVLASNALTGNKQIKVKIDIELTPATLQFTRPPDEPIECPLQKKANVSFVISIREQGAVRTDVIQKFCEALCRQLRQLPCVSCEVKILTGRQDAKTWNNPEWVKSMRCLSVNPL